MTVVILTPAGTMVPQTPFSYFLTLLGSLCTLWQIRPDPQLIRYVVI